MAKGRLAGPLAGVVLCIKDQYDTFDLRTTCGYDADFADDRPPRDATFVAKLRAAGAIILAKSNTGEGASGVPRSSFGGAVANPYDTRRSPAGSSAGSAAACAASLVCAAVGGESGTSIRGPASYTSIVGLAPTVELISRAGDMASGTHVRYLSS